MEDALYLTCHLDETSPISSTELSKLGGLSDNKVSTFPAIVLMQQNKLNLGTSHIKRKVFTESLVESHMCITRGICRVSISVEKVVGRLHPDIPFDELGIKVVSSSTPLSDATSTKALLMP